MIQSLDREIQFGEVNIHFFSLSKQEMEWVVEVGGVGGECMGVIRLSHLTVILALRSLAAHGGEVHEDVAGMTVCKRKSQLSEKCTHFYTT